MISQMEAVIGRKPKRRYIDIINARTPYLPGLYSAKEQREYQDETLALSREQLEEETKQAEKALKLQKEQAREANTLGYINLGLTGGLGYMKNQGLKNTLTSDSGGKIASAGGGSTGGSPSVTPGVSGGYTGFTPTESVGSQIGSAFTSPSTYGYGGLGYLGGKAIGGKDKAKAGLWGAGISAGLNLLSGGSITSAVISGLLGGGSAALF